MWPLVLLAMVFTLTRDKAVKLATEALIRERGFEPQEVRARRASPIEWPDESLGCPEPGKVYSQNVTAGYRVTLQARGETFSVHVGGGRAVVCGRGFRALGGARSQEPIEAEPDPAIPLPENPRLRELALAARTDLAREIEVESDSIELLGIEEVVWPDASLGCPKPGVFYPQVTREGHLIRLRVEKRVYRYHSGSEGPPFLCEVKR